MMLPISDAEMACIRSTVSAAACDLDCIIKRASKTPDAWGSSIETLVPVTTTKAGMSTPSASMIQAYASRLGSAKSWQVRMPYGTDVQEQDILEIGSDVLTVQAILTNSYAATASVLATEVS